VLLDIVVKHLASLFSLRAKLHESELACLLLVRHILVKLLDALFSLLDFVFEFLKVFLESRLDIVIHFEKSLLFRC